MRFILGHSGIKSHKWEVDNVTGCWNWCLWVEKDGYGKMWDSTTQKMRKAYKVIYERVIGPVAKGMQLDHTCRNRRCVNPAHLEPVTRTTNVRRGAGTKLTASQVEEIRKRLQEANDSYEKIGKLFNVSRSAIYGIASGRNWSQV